jgi:hypothetical protein
VSYHIQYYISALRVYSDLSPTTSTTRNQPNAAVVAPRLCTHGARRGVRRCTAFYQDVEMPKWKPVACQCRHRSIHAVLGCNLDRIRLHLVRTSVRATPALAPRIHANPARDSTTNAGIPTHPALRWTLLANGCSSVRSSPDATCI